MFCVCVFFFCLFFFCCFYKLIINKIFQQHDTEIILYLTYNLRYHDVGYFFVTTNVLWKKFNHFQMCV